MTIVALIDHGVGNLRSVEKALAVVGADVLLTKDSDVIASADKIVLPGVGAFGDCVRGLREADLLDTIKELAQSRPMLGICVGMQMLFESSDEMGHHAGLCLLPGKVVRFDYDQGALADPVWRVPHTGWNQLQPTRDSLLLDSMRYGSYAYFNHSYYCLPDESDDVLAYTEYGGTFASVVSRGHTYGIQCHPEKSQSVGLHILRNFVEQG